MLGTLKLKKCYLWSGPYSGRTRLLTNVFMQQFIHWDWNTDNRPTSTTDHWAPLPLPHIHSADNIQSDLIVQWRLTRITN